MGFPTRSDTNRAIQSQKMARVLKFYYLCSENEDADQLVAYCAADLPLCFRIHKQPVSHHMAHTELEVNNYKTHCTHVQVNICISYSHMVKHQPAKHLAI